MATMSLEKARSAKPDLQNRAITMALAILAERIRDLSKQDKGDLFELLKEIPNATGQDDLNEILIGIEEIFDQNPVAAIRLEDELPSEGLQQWMTFVGTKIREARNAANMTQEQLAEKSGLPQSHISRLESHKHSPSRVTLEKIARALNVDLRQLDPSE